MEEKDFIEKIETLQMQRDFYKALLDSLPFTVFAKNKKGEYVYVNKFCNSINNWQNDELIGKTDKDVIGEEGLVDDFEISDRQVVDKKEGFAKLAPLYINGRFVYEYIVKEPLIDKNGKFAGISGAVFPNFSNSEEKFVDNENGLAFDYILDSGKVIVLRSNPDFPLFSKRTLTFEEILKDDCVFDDTAQILGDALSQVVISDVPIHIIVKLFNKDKELKFCDLTLSCYFDKNKKPVRVSGIINVIDKEELCDVQLNIEMENAKRQFVYSGRNNYQLAAYVNVDRNYYHLLRTSSSFSKLKITGKWSDFCREILSRLYKKDEEIFNGILKSVKNQKYLPKDYKKRKFRIEENGKLRWKIYKVEKIRKNSGDGKILYISDINDIVLENERDYEKPEYDEILDVLSTIIEFRNLESDDHIVRVKEFTKILLNQVNKVYFDIYFSPEEIELISMASAIHDIGKISIPDNILLKPGKLTPEEFEIMKTHTNLGYKILKSINKLKGGKYLKYACEIALHHHERWDGKGYPDGLAGDQIPIEAQVVSLADVFDALTSKRCYKDPFSLDSAYHMILNGDCGAFSPQLLECLKNAKFEIFEFASLSHNK